MDTPLAALSAATAALVATAAPGLVTVRSQRAISTGFIWRDGLIVTPDEALAEEGEIAVILPDGTQQAASLAGRDPATDIALLRAGGAAAPVTLSATTPATGALVLAIGASAGAPLAALGLVARVGPAWRSLRGGAIDARIDLDLRLKRQAEGALVLDAQGQAFGMAVFGPRRRVLVIPAATIDRVASALAEHGRIRRGWLGLALHPVRLAEGGAAAMVMSVEPNGPGAGAGLHQGDVIAAIDGAPLTGINALQRSLGAESVGRTVRLAVSRAGTMLEVALTIGERPQG